MEEVAAIADGAHGARQTSQQPRSKSRPQGAHDDVAASFRCGATLSQTIRRFRVKGNGL